MTPVVMLALVVLHATDGHEITIAPHQVTSMRAAAPGKPNKLITEDANCVIGLTDGRFVTVVENCRDVRALMDGK